MLERLRNLYQDWIVPLFLAMSLPAWTLIVATISHGLPPFQTAGERLAYFAILAAGAVAIVLGTFAIWNQVQAHEALAKWGKAVPEETRLQKAFSAVSGAAFFLAMPQVLYEFDLYSELLRDHVDLRVTPCTTLFALCLIQLVFSLAQHFSPPRLR